MHVLFYNIIDFPVTKNSKSKLTWYMLYDISDLFFKQCNYIIH